MAFTIQELQDFSNRKPDVRQITENIIDYLEDNPSGSAGGGGGSATILQSPDDTLWQIQITDAGALVTAQVESGTAGTLNLFSPDNTEWEVTVDDEGALTTTAI